MSSKTILEDVFAIFLERREKYQVTADRIMMFPRQQQAPPRPSTPVSCARHSNRHTENVQFPSYLLQPNLGMGIPAKDKFPDR